MSFEQAKILDEAALNVSRSDLGGNFAKFLRYFEEDGVKSVAAIEAAVRGGNSAGIVEPANVLSDEADQLGARRLSYAAGEIEDAARHLVEIRQTPEQLVPVIVQLREIFDLTMEKLKAETNPLVERSPLVQKKRRVNSPLSPL